MKRWYVFAALTLAGCQSYPEAPPAPPVNPQQALANAKRAITFTLKDPESVRWRRAKVAPNGNVCIEVNAKNSFGGYTGFEPVTYNARTGDVLGAANYAGMWCNHPSFMPKGSTVLDVS